MKMSLHAWPADPQRLSVPGQDADEGRGIHCPSNELHVDHTTVVKNDTSMHFLVDIVRLGWDGWGCSLVNHCDACLLSSGSY